MPVRVLAFDMNDSEDPRSYGQDLLDRGIDSIESVSALMGHSSTRTTERYYVEAEGGIVSQHEYTFYIDGNRGEITTLP